MNKMQPYYEEAVNSIPPEIKKRVDLSMSISDSIASALKSKHISQKEFAKKTGHSEAEVSRWLSGRHNFTLSTIAMISTALGKDLVKVI